MTAVLFAVAILSPEACEQVRAKLLSLRPQPEQESERARVAREAAEAYERECEPAPDTQRSGEITHEQIDREYDERQAELRRTRPWHYPLGQRDEADYPQDDSDVQPHGRLTKYPWGER